jgi:hypothetical protein
VARRSSRDFRRSSQDSVVRPAGEETCKREAEQRTSAPAGETRHGRVRLGGICTDNGWKQKLTISTGRRCPEGGPPNSKSMARGARPWKVGRPLRSWCRCDAPGKIAADGHPTTRHLTATSSAAHFTPLVVILTLTHCNPPRAARCAGSIATVSASSRGIPYAAAPVGPRTACPRTYRLGHLGLLADESLGLGSGDHGLQDERVAIRVRAQSPRRSTDRPDDEPAPGAEKEVCAFASIPVAHPRAAAGRDGAPGTPKSETPRALVGSDRPGRDR